MEQYATVHRNDRGQDDGADAIHRLRRISRHVLFSKQLQKLRISRLLTRRLMKKSAKMAKSYNMEVDKLKEFDGRG